MPKAIFFDAVGTLFYLTKSVGFHYELVARRSGLDLDADALDRAFAHRWSEASTRPAIEGPREDDDKGWWRELVNRVIDDVAPAMQDLDRDTFFEAAYSHFAEAGVWELFPDVFEVLAELHPRYLLAVVSNFDGRLRIILEQLGISKFFRFVFLSSEIGADKPDPAIYRRALEVARCEPIKALHVGDDPVRDWEGATAAGMKIFQLDRKKNSLRDLLTTRSPG